MSLYSTSLSITIRNKTIEAVILSYYYTIRKWSVRKYISFISYCLILLPLFHSLLSYSYGSYYIVNRCKEISINIPSGSLSIILSSF